VVPARNTSTVTANWRKKTASCRLFLAARRGGAFIVAAVKHPEAIPEQGPYFAMSDSDRSRSDRIVHVVAGVISDARGRILLARRTEGRDLAGLWEFPGGKVDPSETPEQALVRELREELGIEAHVGEAVIAVPQQYPHKRLRLDVRRIASWSGAVKGLDGQALVWVPPHKLASYAMPDADRPVVAALRDPEHYLITPEPGDDDARWLSNLRKALDAGIRRVQLRGHTTAALAPERWRRLVERASQHVVDVGGDALVNGDVAMAAALGIGVHLRASQLSALSERPLPHQHLVIASCHSREELIAAQTLGCDAAVLGPVMPTASHPGEPGIGWERFVAMREQVALPIYVLGGMTRDDVAPARWRGAQGIAAIRALWSSQG
jgi:8-oxo-dGTP diphosphatase